MKGRGLLVLAAAVVALAGLWYAASPYWTLWQLREAVRAEDEEALRRLVDFPRVRANLTEDLAGAAGPRIQRELGDGVLGRLGRVVGDVAVEELVEAYVSPRGIFALARGRDPMEGGGRDGEDPELELRRTGFDEFTVTTETALGEAPEMVFARRGVSWRLVTIETGL